MKYIVDAYNHLSYEYNDKEIMEEEFIDKRLIDVTTYEDERNKIKRFIVSQGKKIV